MPKGLEEAGWEDEDTFMWLDPHPNEESFIKSEEDEDMFAGAVAKSSLSDGDGEDCGRRMLAPIGPGAAEDISRA